MLSHTRMGVLYEYTHMGRPIRVWAIYAYGAEQLYYNKSDDLMFYHVAMYEGEHKGKVEVQSTGAFVCGSGYCSGPGIIVIVPVRVT